MRSTRVTSGALLALALAASVAACRDVGEPFRPPVVIGTPGQEVHRLTFSTSDDRAPAWSVGGDTIYYTTSFWEETPQAPSTLLAIAADGSGPARPLLPGVQVGSQLRSRLMAVAPADDGMHVAFIRVGQLMPENACGPDRCPADPMRPTVRLASGALHVRAIDATAPLTEDEMLPLEFSGRSVVVDSTQPGDVLTISNYHPFQLQFEEHGRSFFRPSWNADGTRLAVSDGLDVYAWTVGEETAEIVPFSEDGMLPAWSPDGQTIAFVRYPRIATQFIDCAYIYNNQHVCSERRIIHHHADPKIVLVPFNAIEPIELSDSMNVSATDPAWSPDGRYLYVSTQHSGYSMIGRIDVEARTLELIDGTEGGIEPAVSPDGRRVAFARRTTGSYDIFVAEVP